MDLYQNFLKGRGDGLRLVPWCDAVLSPMVDTLLRKQRSGNQRPAYLWTVLGGLEMIRVGTTCCQNLDISTDGTFRAWADLGLRGVGAITLAAAGGGRNVWQHANPAGMTRPPVALVHGGATVEEALQYRG